ncbi:hypothetical protein AV530_011346 [Patagioenas fasciata monilis]|uniref:Uncharacterized protein n=1 Tax=Patagioenas fasciata monilis TaxID=372326 RepID=A0A1V4KP02_PATFA|nr:hypothetical protein AV530_011346 [Patagioenas fasciata monilis]
MGDHDLPNCCHQIQRHFGNLVSVFGAVPLRQAAHHHVGIANGFHLMGRGFGTVTHLRLRDHPSPSSFSKSRALLSARVLAQLFPKPIMNIWISIHTELWAQNQVLQNGGKPTVTVQRSSPGHWHTHLPGPARTRAAFPLGIAPLAPQHRESYLLDPAIESRDPSEDRRLAVIVAAKTRAKADDTVHFPLAISILAAQWATRVPLGGRGNTVNASHSLEVIPSPPAQTMVVFTELPHQLDLEQVA